MEKATVTMKATAETPKTPTQQVEARMTTGSVLDLPASAVAAPEWIMWMPGGLHQICATRADGQLFEGRVQVDRQTASIAQECLEILANGQQRPWLDFNHQKADASGWPLEFAWRDTPQPGVYMRVAWSRDGVNAITGRSYRSFSPSFFVDDGDPSRVIGCGMNMGGLVNGPAFQAMKPIWAKQAGPAPTSVMLEQAEPGRSSVTLHPNEASRRETNTVKGTNSMDEKNKKKSNTGEQQQQQQQQVDAGAAGADQGASDATQEATLLAENTRLKAEIQARRKADAEAAVNAAVARGAIPPKDTNLRGQWQRLIEADPANQVLLAGLPGNPALTGTTTTGAVQAHDSGEAAASSVDAGGTQIVRVTREDMKVILKGYLDAKSPRDRALLYGSEISARLNAGEVLPLRAVATGVGGANAIDAANALGTLAGALVLQRALELLQFELPILSRISTDLSDATIKWNQTVNVQKLTPPAVTSYSTSTGYASSDITATDVPVVINAHKSVQVDVNVQDMASTNRNLLDEQAAPMVYSLAADLFAAIWALITNSNFANKTTKALASFDRKTVIAMSTALTTRKVGKFKRTLILSPAAYGKLAEDSVVVAIANNPDAAKSITTGKLPDLHGFALQENGLAVDNSEYLMGAAFTPSALALATRVPDDYTKVYPGAAAGARVETIQDPATGFSMMMVQFVDHKLARAYQRVAWMYGVAKGDTEQLERLVTQ